MNEKPSTIYKPCDIRGEVESELTTDLYRQWGLTLGLSLQANEKFVIGGDVRRSTPEFLEALIDGLCQAGLDVVDLGILPTPMIDYARRRLSASGSAVVTGSRSPPSHNGLKWMLGDRPPTPEQITAMCKPVEPENRNRTTSRTLDISFDYVGWLQQTFTDNRVEGMHVVIDPLFGCHAGRARRYLHAIFPHAIFSTLHDEPDPDFGGHHPDCSCADNLEALGDKVYHERADLGIAFDGDADRVALVDDEGTPLTSEESASILLGSFGDVLSGESVVFDLKFSDILGQAARDLRAEPLFERSGHTFLRTRMIDSNALFGAEIGGHYFFHALDGGDDGLFAACWLIDSLARDERRLSQLRRACPAVYMTPELRVPVDSRHGPAVIDHLRATWLDYPQRSIDGIRIDFPDGWALARHSVTESVVTFRFESTGWTALYRLVWRFCDAMHDEVGDTLWARYESAVGHQCPPE